MVVRQDKAVAAEEQSLDSIHHEVLGFVMKLSKPMRIDYWSWNDDRSRIFRTLGCISGTVQEHEFLQSFIIAVSFDKWEV